MVKKFENKFTLCDIIHERDGQTPRQTDSQTPHDGISQAYISRQKMENVSTSASANYFRI